MKLKSYFSGTVEAAMALARQEMGPDAMIVHSRRAMPDTRHLGEYEVVFASAVPDDSAVAKTSESNSVKRVETGDQGFKQLSSEISDLKRQIERMSLRFAANASSAPIGFDQASARILSSLLNADVSESIAEDIAAKSASPDGNWLDALRLRIRFDSSLGCPGKARRIVALVGPPGSGKTTTLVKLAARYALTARKPAQFISADSIRIAGSDQLRAFATILGLGFQSVDSAHSLMLAFEEHRHKDLIFVDTPGLSGRDMDEAALLAAMLTSHSEIDTHLVLPASMRSADLVRVAERYRIFRPSKLIFTRLDETSSPGGMINQAITLGLPVSFVTAGQQIPEDIDPATLKALTDVLNHTGETLMEPVHC